MNDSDQDHVLDFIYERMSDAERAAFEARLEGDSELRERLEAERQLNRSLDSVGNLESRKEAVSRFWRAFEAMRESYAMRRVWRILGPAAGVAAAIVVAVMLFSPPKDDSVPRRDDLAGGGTELHLNNVRELVGIEGDDEGVVDPRFDDPDMKRALDLLASPDGHEFADVKAGELEILRNYEVVSRIAQGLKLLDEEEGDK